MRALVHRKWNGVHTKGVLFLAILAFKSAVGGIREQLLQRT